MTNLYECSDLNFAYKLEKQKVKALQGVDLSVQSGEQLLIIGPSGSGKSTLLNLLGLIEPLQKGEIIFQGQSFSRLSEKERNAIRRFKIGFIFQSFLLFEVLTAAENVEYFLSRQGLSRSERKKRVADALEAVGIGDQAHKRPPEMSGGQRQRVAIARALAKHPAVIIADEPTASLDQKTSRDILDVLKSLRTQGVSVIMSSHDPLAESYASRIVHIMDGQLQSGKGGVL
ncbi:MAG: ABC transporter ATP-binding protein [Chitinophagaceae bacterium]|nr:ABC transporter ATP-binding protein [Oligoflexus sp.]